MSRPMIAAKPTDPAWQPCDPVGAHLLAGLDGFEVGEDVSLVAEIGPRTRVGGRRFRLFLATPDLGRTALPMISGLLSPVRAGDHAWIEVTGYRARLPLADGRTVDVPEGILLRTLTALAERLPAPGSLIVEYESPGFAVTAQALAAGVPPIATPLGGMLFAAGRGALRDHTAAAGARAGRRRLQGERPALESDDDQAQEWARRTLAALQAFMARSVELDWYVQAQTRPVAEAAIAALTRQLASS
ncbi:MAG: DUF1122 family protein [Chloroflexi bacterium]|nr:DUF1122 family protein [Chloroflexota bacterium]